MIEFEINDEYIELNKLLKVTRVVESGAMAKSVVEDNLVYRNGELETRKRAKIRKGETITLWDNEIKVI
jgi:ribosome-associated protein